MTSLQKDHAEINSKVRLLEDKMIYFNLETNKHRIHDKSNM